MSTREKGMIEYSCPVCHGYGFIAILPEEPDCQACNGKGVYYRPKLTKVEAVKLRGSVQVTLATLDNLPYEGGSICLGCLYYDDCLCEPEDCPQCEGFGCIEIADGEVYDNGLRETRECKACEGEGKIYPPSVTVEEYKKRKGYS